jgi:hypothetical protein
VLVAAALALLGLIVLAIIFGHDDDATPPGVDVVADEQLELDYDNVDQAEPRRPFKVGDRLDVDVDDVPMLTETAVHRLADRYKDTSRWAR